jgi:hypothetical protein
VALNGLGDRVQIREGDLWDGVHGDSFHWIFAAPPSFPMPPEFVFAAWGWGGADGLAVTERILAELPRFLRPGGVARVLLGMTGSALGPRLPESLLKYRHDAPRLRAELTLFDRLALTPEWIRHDWVAPRLLAQGLEAGSESFDRVLQRMTSFLAESNATHYYHAHLLVRDRLDIEPDALRVTALYDPLGVSSCPMIAVGVQFRRNPDGSGELSSPTEPGLRTPEDLSFVLGLLDGRRSVAEIGTAYWERYRAEPAPEAAIQTILEIVRNLLRLEILTLENAATWGDFSVTTAGGAGP